MSEFGRVLRWPECIQMYLSYTQVRLIYTGVPKVFINNVFPKSHLQSSCSDTSNEVKERDSFSARFNIKKAKYYYIPPTFQILVACGILNFVYITVYVCSPVTALEFIYNRFAFTWAPEVVQRTSSHKLYTTYYSILCLWDIQLTFDW